MKHLPLLAALTLGLASLPISVRAADSAPVAPNTLSPELQALLVELLKNAGEQAAAASEAPEAPAAAVTPVVPEPKPRRVVTSGLQTGGLTTGRLATPTLAPANGLTNAPRLTVEEWRALFPAKNDRR